MSGRESKEERLDRELIEFLNELRVALPGVQVLFAFLLIVPFSNGYGNMTDLQKDVYFITFFCTAASSVFLIAPSAQHRLRWREYDKERLLVVANRQTIAGLVLLALAMSGATFLVTDILFELTSAAVATGVVAALFTWFWFGWPLWREARDQD
jgi:Kef-type K+ transport system membrane component KefB